jgi:DNA-binding MarR family transcriptional regulator
MRLTKEERQEYAHLSCLEELDALSPEQHKMLRALREKKEISNLSPDYAFGGRYWGK